MMLYQKIIVIFGLLFNLYGQQALCLIVGSNTAVSRQARVRFPAVDSNNQMLGHASFPSGFRLDSETTTCTYDNFYSVAGSVNFRGGRFTLRQDLVLGSKTRVIRGGRIEGNNYSIEFLKQPNLKFPAPAPGGCGDLMFHDQESMTKEVLSVSWSPDGTYLAASSANTNNADPELQLYTFDGAVLTATTNGAVDLTRAGNEVRWHPTTNHLAVCRDSLSGEEVQVYFRDISNGSLTVTGSGEAGGDATACAWHPSGDYLLVGSSNTTKGLILYSFANGVLTEIQGIELPTNRIVNNGAMSWAPGGNYVAIGRRSGPSPVLLVYHFDGTLTLTASNAIGSSVESLDWNPTGTSIAVGLAGTKNRLRIYQHRVTNGTLTEVISLGIPTSSTVADMHWSNDGTCLAIGTSAGNNSRVDVYGFDTSTQQLSLFDRLDSSVGINAVRFSPDNKFIGSGDRNNFVSVYSLDGGGDTGVETEPFYFKNTSLIFNVDIEIRAACYFDGTCRVNARGAGIAFKSHGKFVVRPGARLIMEDLTCDGLGSNNIHCMTENGDITLRNCGLALSRDYTFSRGGLFLEQDVVISGTNKFIYGVSRTSTVASGARLILENGLTFSYAPITAKQNLLYMTDETSILHMNGCTLHSTRTGIALSNGVLVVENKVTFSSEARNTGEGMVIAESATTCILGDAMLDIHGHVKYA